MVMEETSQEKLVRLLKDLFQFDVSELDFGIYRIMNHKRKEIERFIEKDLVERANVIFKEYAGESSEAIKKELDRLGSEINDVIEPGTIDQHGRVTKHHDIKKVREYLKKWEDYESAKNAQGKVDDVYNHIYEFFSRYYDKGDFFTKRRYGGKDKYVIPYNGEEVMLHWANKDQYYIKTGEYFANYEFKAGSWRVRFVLTHAEIDPNSVKGDMRYFVLADQEPEIDNKKKELWIFFNFRALTVEEEKGIKSRNKQDELVVRAKERVLSLVTDPDIVQNLNKKVKVGDGEKSLLEKNLDTYVTKNTTDYFIHKDLGSFLDRELEIYIRNEVLLLDEILSMNDTTLRQTTAHAKVVREIGHQIIDFLSQIEDFQKMLWEKKKLVLRTDYCITLDMVFKEFYAEVARNKRQVAEWKQLFALDDVTEGTLYPTKGKDVLPVELLEIYPHLVLDTSFFDQEFKDRLLASLDNIENQLDGLLVKSENWQALNLLSAKYSGAIKCIYIDPPFNLGENPDYLYRVDYKDSTWITLLQDRLVLARNEVDPNGSIFVRCNHDGNMLLRLLMDSVFGKTNFRNEIIVRRAEETKGDLNKQFETVRSMTVNYDNIFWYSINPGMRFGQILKPTTEEQSKSHWHSFWKAEDRPRLRYDILGIDLTSHYGQWMWKKERAYAAVENYKEYLEIQKQTKENLDDYWLRTGRNLEFVKRDGNGFSSIKYWIPPRSFVMADNNWLDIKGYANKWDFKTENSEPLLKRIVDGLTEAGDIVMDFFLGSGTTVAASHKLSRRWIGIEMGNHFDSRVLPRMKTVLWGDDSGISKEVQWDGGGFFKYIYLEQYEDSLNNIAFQTRDDKIQERLDTFGDYFVRYMLDYETRGSPSRLKISEFEDPFNYKMRIFVDGEERFQSVDLVETFNYLFGIEVIRILSEKDDDRYYRAVRGKLRDGKTVLVIWRNTKGIDLKRDRDFIERIFLKDGKPDILYVNGQCYVKDAVSIEPDFKKLMGA